MHDTENQKHFPKKVVGFFLLLLSKEVKKRRSRLCAICTYWEEAFGLLLFFLPLSLRENASSLLEAIDLATIRFGERERKIEKNSIGPT